MTDPQFQGILPYGQPQGVEVPAAIDEPPDSPWLEAALTVGATFALLPLLLQLGAVVMAIREVSLAALAQLPPTTPALLRFYPNAIRVWLLAVGTNCIMLGFIAATSWLLARRSYSKSAGTRFLRWICAVFAAFTISIAWGSNLRVPGFTRYSTIGHPASFGGEVLMATLLAVITLLACWIGDGVKAVGPLGLARRLWQDARGIFGPLILGLAAGLGGGLAWGILQTLKIYESVMLEQAILGFATPFALLGIHIGAAASLYRLLRRSSPPQS